MTGNIESYQTDQTRVLLNFTVNADWPGGSGELVVSETGQRVAILGEISLQSVVFVAGVTLVPHRLTVGWRSRVHPGQHQLAGRGRGRWSYTVRPCRVRSGQVTRGGEGDLHSHGWGMVVTDQSLLF